MQTMYQLQVFAERESIELPDGGTTVLGPIRYLQLVDNRKISYSITEGNELGHFQINNETGALLVGPGADLDINNITQYILTVMIVDGGGLNDTAEVTINILDANDNPPVFIYPVNYTVTIPEDVPIVLSVSMLLMLTLVIIVKYDILSLVESRMIDCRYIL